jgi:hypothetical protein
VDVEISEIFSFFLFLWLNLNQDCHSEVSSSSFPGRGMWKKKHRSLTKWRWPPWRVAEKGGNGNQHSRDASFTPMMVNAGTQRSALSNRMTECESENGK